MLELPQWFRLNRRELEQQFAIPAVELKEILSHDLHGPLPEILIHVNAADRLGAFDRLGREVTKMCVISRLRRELDEAFSGTTFLPPTRLDGRCVAGMHARTLGEDGLARHLAIHLCDLPPVLVLPF
jgi:hypothetical protein